VNFERLFDGFILAKIDGEKGKREILFAAWNYNLMEKISALRDRKEKYQIMHF